MFKKNKLSKTPFPALLRPVKQIPGREDIVFFKKFHFQLIGKTMNRSTIHL